MKLPLAIDFASRYKILHLITIQMASAIYLLNNTRTPA
jgi:hypothetical protein